MSTVIRLCERNVCSELNFNNYNLKFFASGGYGKLYIAYPKNPKKSRLCLKFLNKTLTQNSVHLTHFQEELFLLKCLQHTGLPQLVHDGSNSGRPYLAYPLIEGRTILSLLQESVGSDRNLFQIINKPIDQLFEHLNILYTAPHPNMSKNISTLLAINIMIQLLEILDYLHSQPDPVVHSDISPENLLLDHTNKLFLIDFGCARFIKQGGEKSNINWIGKPSYLSPEQAQGLDWDQRSDLYQAGIVFYELLCLHKKNFGINEQEARVFSANPPLLNLFYIPSFLYAYITKLLHTDLNERWQSAGECLAELKNVSSKFLDSGNTKE